MKTPDTHWRTKEGQLVALYDMEDSHLGNSLAMIRRNLAVLQAKVASFKETEAKLVGESMRRINAQAEKKRLAKIAAKKASKIMVKPEGNARKFRED